MLHESECEIIIIGVNPSTRKYIMNKNKEQDSISLIEPNTSEEYKHLILKISEKYSAYSWTSFVINISSLLHNTHLMGICIFYNYINSHLENLIKDNMNNYYKLEYLCAFYDNSHKIYNETQNRLLTEKDNLLLNLLLEIVNKTKHIVDNIICKCDFTNNNILIRKTLIAMQRANKFKNHPLYHELVAFSYCNPTRMRENDMFD